MYLTAYLNYSLLSKCLKVQSQSNEIQHALILAPLNQKVLATFMIITPCPTKKLIKLMSVTRACMNNIQQAHTVLYKFTWLSKGSLHASYWIWALTVAKFVYPHSRHPYITILINVDNLWSWWSRNDNRASSTISINSCSCFISTKSTIPTIIITSSPLYSPISIQEYYKWFISITC